MIISFETLNASRIYHTMTQTLIPRPIAWVLTKNDADIGGFNLAPFSYFTAISSDPALVLLSIGKKADEAGSDKDTLRNLKAQKQCVIHIANAAQVDQLNATAKALPYGESEVGQLALTDFENFDLPRLDAANIAFACQMHQVMPIDNSKQTMVLLKVESVFVDDAMASTDDKGRVKINADNIDPLARLGTGEYWVEGHSLKKSMP